MHAFTLLDNGIFMTLLTGQGNIGHLLELNVVSFRGSPLSKWASRHAKCVQPLQGKGKEPHRDGKALLSGFADCKELSIC